MLQISSSCLGQRELGIRKQPNLFCTVLQRVVLTSSERPRRPSANVMLPTGHVDATNLRTLVRARPAGNGAPSWPMLAVPVP